MKRNIEIAPIYERGMREPRPGELNFELKRILVKFCTDRPLKEAHKSVQAAVSRLARQWGVNEFECGYDRNTNTRGGEPPWVVEGISVRMWRRRPNGTLAIHRAGATSHPRRSVKNPGYVVITAPRDLCIFYGIDDPADWRYHCIKNVRPGLVAKWKRDGRKGF